jgi:hypothetical protein
MKTAVEWLFEELKIRYDIYNSESLFNKAKEMEKQQIEDAFTNGYNYCYERELECQNDDFEIDYYNETFDK